MTDAIDQARGPKRRQSLTVRVNNDVKRVVMLPQYERPQTRADCVNDGFNAERPCPFVGCEYHLYLGVGPSGNITFAFPKLEPDELAETCCLDVADAQPDLNRGAGRPIKLHKKLITVAQLTNTTKQAISHMEQKVFRALLIEPTTQLSEAAE